MKVKHANRGLWTKSVSSWYNIKKATGDDCVAIDVTIKAGLFHWVPLPFEVIIGNVLHYGNTEDYVQTMDG